MMPLLVSMPRCFAIAPLGRALQQESAIVDNRRPAARGDKVARSFPCCD